VLPIPRYGGCSGPRADPFGSPAGDACCSLQHAPVRWHRGGVCPAISQTRKRERPKSFPFRVSSTLSGCCVLSTPFTGWWSRLRVAPAYRSWRMIRLSARAASVVSAIVLLSRPWTACRLNRSLWAVRVPSPAGDSSPVFADVPPPVDTGSWQARRIRICFSERHGFDIFHGATFVPCSWSYD
jgi:hypothetical protein